MPPIKLIVEGAELLANGGAKQAAAELPSLTELLPMAGRSLRKVVDWSHKGISSADLELRLGQAKGLENVSTLNLGFNPLYNDGLRTLAEFTKHRGLNVRNLSLHHVGLNDVAAPERLEALQAFRGTRLENLDLAQNHMLSGRGLQYLDGLPIKRLDLHHSSMLKDAAIANAARLERLTHIGLNGCKDISPEGWSYLQSMKRLKFLDVRATTFDDTAASYLPNLPVRSLFAWSTNLTEKGLLDGVAQTKSLRTLVIGDKRITAGSVAKFEALRPDVTIAHWK